MVDKIEEIIKEIGDEIDSAFWDGIEQGGEDYAGEGYIGGLSEELQSKLKSLFKEYAMEIINTKIKSFGFDKASQEMGADMLRAEQREKVGDI